MGSSDDILMTNIKYLEENQVYITLVTIHELYAAQIKTCCRLRASGAVDHHVLSHKHRDYSSNY